LNVIEKNDSWSSNSSSGKKNRERINDNKITKKKNIKIVFKDETIELMEIFCQNIEDESKRKE
jgi:hypothetical protein